eukprot:gene22575-28708_t
MTRGGLKKKYLSSSMKAEAKKSLIESDDNSSTAMSKTAKPSSPSATASFVLNSDMAKIRQAELVILREEEKFGILSKDPDGRLMPRLQALTRQAHVELKKDDRRPLTDASQTVIYAPHAASSDVGVAEPNWTPDAVGEGGAAKEKSSSLAAGAKVSHFLEEVDDSVKPRHRGVGKVGGILSSTHGRGVESRGRRPLITNLSSDMEYKRHRQIRTLGDKLSQIAELRDAILAEKARLQQEEEETQLSGGGNRTILRPISRGSSAGNAARKVDVIRSAVSNHTHSPQATTRKGGDNILRSGSAAGESRVSINETSTPPGPPSSFTGMSPKPSSPLRGIRKQVSVDESTEEKEGRTGSPSEGGRSSPKISFRKAAPLKKGDSDRKMGSADKEATVARITEEIEKQEEELRRLENAQIETNQKLNHFVRDEEKIVALKEMEKSQVGRERSRDIERKRRLLSEKEGRRVGPPPEDQRNVYDYYAIRVQSAIRGFLARCWIRWYIEVSLKACKVLQAVMRGWFGRMRVRKIRREFSAARNIQRNFRGWSTRGTSSAMAKRQNLAKNAVVIQRVWRGILGVRRCISKRALDQAAKAAFECVDAKSISIGDVKELARRILYAIEEPSATTFPPDEVLHLIRMTVMVIQSARGNLGLAGYDFFNARGYDELGGDELSWLQAAKMVNRAERFMRLVRVMAYGPGAKPPRLVQLPNNANLLYAAQAQNPRWTLSTFETMGAGSKICCKLFQWLTSIIEVAGRQQEFLSLIATSFPDWLPKLYDLQKASRVSEFEIEMNKKCMSILELFKSRSMDDDTLLSVLDKEMLLVKRASNDARGRMRDTMLEIDKLKNDQSSREVYALLATEQKVLDNNTELDEMAKAFQQAFRLAQQGDRASIEALSELKVNLTNQRLKVTELEGQKKLLDMQVEMNRTKRKNPARLTPDILARVLLAGEAKAAYIMAQVKARTMLRSSGVKHASDLPMHLVEVHDELSAEEELTRAEARKLLVEAENERKIHDDVMARSLAENEVKEQKSKDKMSPTEQELQEERTEDELEARNERLKHKQYLPDSVLLVCQPRPRPVIIALSRDLSQFAKQRIHAEVTRLMPGLFVTIDHKENMGLDFKAMQSVLDSGKCLIMSVDHGLTRVTRDSFLQNFEINVKALVPSPSVAMAIGDETNRRGICGQQGGAYLGVEKSDMTLMRDGDIKVQLEGMAWVAHEMTRPETRAIFQKRAAELVPQSKPFVFVLEAFFVILSGNDSQRSPDEGFAAQSWRATRTLLVEPRGVAAKILQYRRGSATLQMCEVIGKYLQHRLWPVPFAEERSVDIAINLLASYVEMWLTSERASAHGDGVPLQALTKSSMRGFQSVVVVADSADPEDLVDLQNGSGFVGWRMAASKLVRAALQDLRVLKNTSKIDGKLFTVSVYRETATIYLEAYDPATSSVYLTSVSIDDVPALLVPNGFGLETGIVETPMSPHEMYMSMVKLLRFDRASKHKDAERILVCRRDNTFLCNVTRRINGHLVLLKCYEAALGQLFFTAYIPEFSAKIKLLVADTIRLGVLRNADTLCDSLEHQFVDKEDARHMLSFMLDRLRLSPSMAMTKARGIDLNDGYRDKQGLQSDIHRLGFSLKVRTHGGAGRILTRKVRLFHGVPHVLEIRTVSYSKTLKISIYEPRMRTTLRLSLSAYMRSLLLPEVSDNLCWLPSLMARVKVDWKGDRRLVLDTCLYKSGRKIGAQRLVMKFNAIDDPDQVQLSLFDQVSCELYSCVLTKDQVLALLSFEQPSETLHRDTKTAGRESIAVTNILQTLTFTSDAAQIDPSDGTEKPTLRSILLDRQALERLAGRLESLLEPVDASKLLFGYTTRKGPVVLSLGLENSVGASLATPMDTTLRYSPRMKQSDRDGSADGVTRSRRQPVVVQMEDELNELAARLALNANMQVLIDTAAAKKIDEHILSIEDEEQLEEVIGEATSATALALLDTIHSTLIDRFEERNSPGHEQALFEERAEALARIPRVVAIIPEPNPILGKEWESVFETGVKTNFREGKVRWHGHVSVKISQTICWVGDDGAGKRYKFDVYEPKVAQSFEGIIRSKKHLIEILGLHGQDLLHKDRAREMLLFVCKHRMDVVVNKKTWDGVDVERGAPPYRIEFQSDRLYSGDKVTPLNVGGDEDEEANKEKLLDMDNARGKKVVRLVRRVSGLIMQLTVFDIPEAIVAASEKQRALQNGSGAPSALPTGRQQNVIENGVSTKSGIAFNDGAMVSTKEGASQQVENTTTGFAEVRVEVEILSRYAPPAFRIVGYDPRSKRKVTLIVEPQAIVEVSGGVFSPYLHPEKKKDLARVVCDALVLLFPPGRPFELVVPWSGAKKDISNATVSGEAKLSMRSSAERVVQRSGRLFRSAMRISKYDLLVSLYSHGGTDEATSTGTSKQLIFNFYSPAVSEAAEVVVSETEQIERVGRPILMVPEGAMRAAAVRSICKFFRCEIIEDILDPKIKTMHVVLLPPDKGFVTDYQQVSVPPPGADIRPVGIPAVFFPLDSCGRVVHRRGMALACRDKKQPDRDFLVTVYTKSDVENPERGLVIKLYDRAVSSTSILHLGASEIMRQCTQADEPDLLSDMVLAKTCEMDEALALDEIESGFTAITVKGQLEAATQKLVDRLLDIVLSDLGYLLDAQDHVVPYLKSVPRGIPPS